MLHPFKGSALNIDPMRFYGQLYKDLLPEMTSVLKDQSSVTPLFLKCLHKMIVARSKQVSSSSVFVVVVIVSFIVVIGVGRYCRHSAVLLFPPPPL